MLFDLSLKTSQVSSTSFQQTQTPPLRQRTAAECECKHTDWQTVLCSCPASAPLQMKRGR